MRRLTSGASEGGQEAGVHACMGCAEQGLFCGGSSRNRDHFHGSVTFPDGLAEQMRLLLFSPETSGGLLIAFGPFRLGRLAEAW
jgi:selenophosphate synthase